MDNVKKEQKRHRIAEAFYDEYFDTDSDTIIDALAVLISYGSDLDRIVEQMALTLYENE